MSKYRPRFEVVDSQEWRKIKRNGEYKGIRCKMVGTEDGHEEAHIILPRAEKYGKMVYNEDRTIGIYYPNRRMFIKTPLTKWHIYWEYESVGISKCIVDKLMDRDPHMLVKIPFRERINMKERGETPKYIPEGYSELIPLKCYDRSLRVIHWMDKGYELQKHVTLQISEFIGDHAMVKGKRYRDREEPWL